MNVQQPLHRLHFNQHQAGYPKVHPVGVGNGLPLVVQVQPYLLLERQAAQPQLPCKATLVS